jgi:hypothetical protein
MSIETSTIEQKSQYSVDCDLSAVTALRDFIESYELPALPENTFVLDKRMYDYLESIGENPEAITNDEEFLQLCSGLSKEHAKDFALLSERIRQENARAEQQEILKNLSPEHAQEIIRTLPGRVFRDESEELHSEVLQRIGPRYHHIIQSPNAGKILEEYPNAKNEHKFAVVDFGRIHSLFEDNKIRVNDGQRIKKINPLDIWITIPHRQKTLGTLLNPGGSVPPGYLNKWNGFAVEPRKGDCHLWFEHLRDFICRGNRDHYDYLRVWLADIVQNPGRKNGVGIALTGGQGAGKGIFAHEFGKLFSPFYFHLYKKQHLNGDFDSHLAESVVAFFDEGVLRNDDTSRQVLKYITTEEDQFVNEKYIVGYTAPSFLHLIIASNNRKFLPIDEDDRRFFVLEVSNKFAGRNKASDRSGNFDPIGYELSHGGKEAILYELLHQEITRNVKDFPYTDIREEQVEDSEDIIKRWWKDFLFVGIFEERMLKTPCDDWENGPVEIVIFQLHEVFLEYCKQNFPRAERMGIREFCRELRRFAPNLMKGKPETAKRDISPTNNMGIKNKLETVRVYQIPKLEACRDEARRTIGYRDDL